jgi:hypothetical protein
MSTNQYDVLIAREPRSVVGVQRRRIEERRPRSEAVCAIGSGQVCDRWQSLLMLPLVSLNALSSRSGALIASLSHRCLHANVKFVDAAAPRRLPRYFLKSLSAYGVSAFSAVCLAT